MIAAAAVAAVVEVLISWPGPPGFVVDRVLVAVVAAQRVVAVALVVTRAVAAIVVVAGIAAADGDVAVAAVVGWC